MKRRSGKSKTKPKSAQRLGRKPTEAPSGTLGTYFLERFKDLPPEWQPPDPASPRGRILHAARKLFALRGLSETSTRAIAEEAGVNLAMIHYYYGSKDALYERVLAQEFITVMQRMSKLMKLAMPPHEIILTIPTRIMTVLRDHPVWLTFLRHEVAFGGAHMFRALKNLGGLGPLGLRQFFDTVYAEAVAQKRLRSLPADPLRELLITISWGGVFLQPFFQQMFERDLSDEAVWTEWQTTLDALLRRGLLLESAS